MFDQTFVNTHPHARRPWTVAASLALQTGLVAVAVILPLLNPEILRPKLQDPVYFVLRQTVKQPVAVELAAMRHSTPRVFNQALLLTAPRSIPAHANLITDDAPVVSSAGLMPGAQFGGFPGIGIALPEPMPEPARPRPAPQPAVVDTVAKGPMRVSLGVQSARLIFGPKPQYPSPARAARMQGIVRIQAIITPEGIIKDLHVLSGPPLLVNAALEAVRQWRYQPTLLNGSAVEVITEIDVNFTFSQ
jgi:protein TonB